MLASDRFREFKIQSYSPGNKDKAVTDEKYEQISKIDSCQNE